MRRFLIGMVVGTLAVALWAIETVRRDAERDRVHASRWPHPDGRYRSYGEVWDHPSPADQAGHA